MFVLIGFLLLLAGLAAGSETPAVSFLAQADAAYAQRSDLPQARIALLYYEKAIGAAPADIEASWKASRAAWWLGENADSNSEKIAYFQKGISFSQKVLARRPDCVEAHFWLGVNDASYGEVHRALKSLFLLKPIRHEMAEVLRLNDRYSGGGAYRVLGVVDYKVPGFAGGSKKRSLKELNQALAIDPQDPFTRYHLAEYFMRVGDKEKAEAERNTLQSLRVPSESLPELRMLQEKAKKLF